MAKISLKELSQHKSKDSLWVAVEGKIYDITKFQDRHPGGAKILNKVGGTDATKHFLKFHPTDVLRILDSSEYIGELDSPSSDTKAPSNETPSDETKTTSSELRPISNTPQASANKKLGLADETYGKPTTDIALNYKNKPHLGEIYNLFDFECVARYTMDRLGWYYFSSGSDDEITMRENHSAFHRIWFRPKVLVDVSTVDFSTEVLGEKISAPFYITATASGKMGHPDGEVNLTKAASKHHIPQMVSTLSSASIDDVCANATPGQPIWLQVYVNADREATRKFVKHAESLGVSAFFVTVDAPQLGRREKDMRTKFDPELADEEEENEGPAGNARAISTYIDTRLSWDDVPYLLSLTSKPVFIKGVGRWEDAVKAASLGFAGAVLSNHGGRQLEFAPSGVEILAETVPKLRAFGLDKKFDLFIDGGVRRGTDILKALALGAKAVGIGRPFLYAMSTYGVPGVNKAINLLKDELEMNMRLLGITKLDQLGPDMVSVRNLSSHDSVPADYAFSNVYERLPQPLFRQKM